MSALSATRDFLSLNGRKALFTARGLVPAKRTMPGFMLIGAQKSGTSSMFAYLRQHPQIVRPIFKEPYFFDRHYARGLSWYGRNFPTRSAIDRLNNRYGRPHVTFEATATYVFDPDVPRRIAKDVETQRFVLLLRNPVDRAISNFHHARRQGRETRPLMEALEADFNRYEAEKAFEDGRGPEPKGPAPRPTYVRRGIYHEAVAEWHRVFSPERLLVVQSEEMFADPQAVMRRVFAFLGLATVDGIDYRAQNVGGYRESDADARRVLQAFYAPHNECLGRMIGTSVAW